MNEKRYTPGPWIVSPNLRIVTDEGEPWHVAEVMVGIEGEPELANARLIAAAPDLVEALEELSRAHEGWEKGLGPCVCDAHKKARAALAKALGGDQA